MKLQSTSDQAAVVTPENIDRNTPLLETIISNIAKGLAASKKQDSESLLALIPSLKIAQDSLRKDWTSHPWSLGASCEIERIAKDRSQNILKKSTLPLFANQRDLKKKIAIAQNYPSIRRTCARMLRESLTHYQPSFIGLVSHAVCSLVLERRSEEKVWFCRGIYLKILTVSLHSGVRVTLVRILLMSWRSISSIPFLAAKVWLGPPSVHIVQQKGAN